MRLSKSLILTRSVIFAPAFLGLTVTVLAQAPADRAASAEAESGTLENAFLWTLATPLITHAGNKAIDWLFETVSTRAKPGKAPVAALPSVADDGRTATPVQAASAAKMPARVTASVAQHTAQVRKSVGIAYRLYRVQPDRSEVVATPDEEFRSGDRIVVRFVANLPGLLRVTNSDAQGQVQALGHGFVQGATTARLGPFEFYGAPGRDVLTLTLQPCRPDGAALPTSLKLTYGDRAAAINPGVLAALPNCSAFIHAPAKPLESLRQVSEQTAYAMAVPSSALGSETTMQAVVTRIPLRHR